MANYRNLVLIAVFCLVFNPVKSQTPEYPPEEDQEPGQPTPIAYQNIPERALKYLKALRYLKDGSDHDATSLENAIKSMQSHAGLKQTGLLDEATLAKMEMPRCGFKASSGMNKRFRLGSSKWDNLVLDWKIENYPSNVNQLTNDDVDRIIAAAFDTWAEAAPALSFPVSTSSEPTLAINFLRKDHSDGDPFDGPGGTLAHGFYPKAGLIHFDDDELWTQNGEEGIDLAQVAIHEFGHALGLNHTNVPGSIMISGYSRYIPNVGLGQDDIDGILTLYPE